MQRAYTFKWADASLPQVLLLCFRDPGIEFQSHQRNQRGRLRGIGREFFILLYFRSNKRFHKEQPLNRIETG